MPGDFLDSSALVHCYLQEGSGEAPAWSIAYDKYGTHEEEDTDHSKRDCQLVTGASLTVRCRRLSPCCGTRAAFTALAIALNVRTP